MWILDINGSQKLARNSILQKKDANNGSQTRITKQFTKFHQSNNTRDMKWNNRQKKLPIIDWLQSFFGNP